VEPGGDQTLGGAGWRWPGYAVRPAYATGAKAEGAVQPNQQPVLEPGTGAERVRHGASSEGAGGETDPWPRRHSAIYRVAGPSEGKGQMETLGNCKPHDRRRE